MKFFKKHEVKEPETSEELDGKPTSKAQKIINVIVNVILVVAIIIAAGCTYNSYVSSSGSGVPSFFGIQMLSIQTDSMDADPANFKVGDLIINKTVKDTSKLEVGDIISYWTIIDGERAINTHRIVNIFDGESYRFFETKGDNNPWSDTLTVHESEVIGEFAFRIPGVGKVIDYLQTSTGFLLVVVLPVAIFFLYHIIMFFRVLFEYQNVKVLIKYEEERGKNEDLIEKVANGIAPAPRAPEPETAIPATAPPQNAETNTEEVAAAQAEKTREQIEAELREKIRAELLAQMQQELNDKK